MLHRNYLIILKYNFAVWWFIVSYLRVEYLKTHEIHRNLCSTIYGSGSSMVRESRRRVQKVAGSISINYLIPSSINLLNFCFVVFGRRIYHLIIKTYLFSRRHVPRDYHTPHLTMFKLVHNVLFMFICTVTCVLRAMGYC